MRSGMERPIGEDVRLRCPLFLFSEETAEDLEALLRDLRGGSYTPLSLRELFRCRRGLRPWPSRPCAILLRDVSFATLRRLLPLLAQWETPVSLFCGTPFGEAEEFRSSRWLQFYGDASADADRHIAAFCETLDARTVGSLRENRIWMAVTPTGTVGSVPGGIDLLYALPVRPGNRLPELFARWNRSLTAEPEVQEMGLRLEEPRSLLLPIGTHPPVEDPHAAVYLSILGDTPERMEQAMADPDWGSVFDPTDGSYRLCPPRKALARQPLPEATPEALLRALEGGSYPFLPARGLLLFGYDGEREVFPGMLASEDGGYERTDLRSCTPEIYRKEGWICLTPDRSVRFVTPDGVKAWAEEVREERSAAGDLLCGWDASVAFVNRVSAGMPVSAASLRAFLEERMLSAFRLRYICQQENLYTEPADRYSALLEQEGRPVLRALRGPEGAEDLPEPGTLLQRFLNAEGLCRRDLSEAIDRMRALQAFRAGKNCKKD